MKWLFGRLRKQGRQRTSGGEVSHSTTTLRNTSACVDPHTSHQRTAGEASGAHSGSLCRQETRGSTGGAAVVHTGGAAVVHTGGGRSGTASASSEASRPGAAGTHRELPSSSTYFRRHASLPRTFKSRVFKNAERSQITANDGPEPAVVASRSSHSPANTQIGTGSNREAAATSTTPVVTPAATSAATPAATPPIATPAAHSLQRSLSFEEALDNPITVPTRQPVTFCRRIKSMHLHNNTNKRSADPHHAACESHSSHPPSSYFYLSNCRDITVNIHTTDAAATADAAATVVSYEDSSAHQHHHSAAASEAQDKVYVSAEGSRFLNRQQIDALTRESIRLISDMPAAQRRISTNMRHAADINSRSNISSNGCISTYRDHVKSNRSRHTSAGSQHSSSRIRLTSAGSSASVYSSDEYENSASSTSSASSSDTLVLGTPGLYSTSLSQTDNKQSRHCQTSPMSEHKDLIRSSTSHPALNNNLCSRCRSTSDNTRAVVSSRPVGRVQPHVRDLPQGFIHDNFSDVSSLSGASTYMLTVADIGTLSDESDLEDVDNVEDMLTDIDVSALTEQPDSSLSNADTTMFSANGIANSSSSSSSRIWSYSAARSNTRSTIHEKLERIRAVVLKMPGVLLVGVQQNRIIVTLSPLRQNFDDIIALMRTHDVDVLEYECVVLSHRYRVQRATASNTGHGASNVNTASTGHGASIVNTASTGHGASIVNTASTGHGASIGNTASTGHGASIVNTASTGHGASIGNTASTGHGASIVNTASTRHDANPGNTASTGNNALHTDSSGYGASTGNAASHGSTSSTANTAFIGSHTAVVSPTGASVHP